MANDTRAPSTHFSLEMMERRSKFVKLAVNFESIIMLMKRVQMRCQVHILNLHPFYVMTDPVFPILISRYTELRQSPLLLL